ncbi:RNA polymerase II C-terminal domain phosphatase-like 4 isoform X1 [Nymphaea colorata]|nr:RNA polymerase II C-terminal domain phosphatase-like 4 isoform X1 [Nymphaea colorata]XP_031473758.1 RNA polymerase II C-terminal domain phosphatase-like 4 isoform X1 [Nymphaea colorata]XP_031473759.1 RNA polymerase II C-terminal domain phosphatase-like 4 isoform X1 [Nymphaea colorata]XP_031473761.1 RNA polymerase II C-terminal domain phosphatase-like 4 isoform X1 [Nymphaea colorata]
MSTTAESPVHSSSSDDFAAILETELDSNTSGTSPDSHVSFALEDVELERTKRQRVYETEEADIPDSVALEYKVCPPHPGFIRQMCIRCGQLEDAEASVPFDYIHKDLKLGTEEVARLRNADIKNLLSRQKLYLILDLDHTLLNSTRLADISPQEEAYVTETYLKRQSDASRGDTAMLFRLDRMHMMTKLRPYVHTFLREASTMFEMYIYTMAERPYALEMANMLDPKGVYFPSKVISQADCTQKHQKGLDVVLGLESAVVILDDTEMVWQKHKENLILMERYHFFASSCHQYGFNNKSLTELMRDESESEGALATILNVLKRVHAKFFDPGLEDYTDRDVREVLKAIRKDILKGCKIMFSRVHPTRCPADTQPLWKMAENLGAACSTEIDSSITHVVTVDLGTEKSRWAVQQKKFVVSPGWLEAANYLWQRQPEERFPVTSKNSKGKGEASSNNLPTADQLG